MILKAKILDFLGPWGYRPPKGRRHVWNIFALPCKISQLVAPAQRYLSPDKKTTDTANSVIARNNNNFFKFKNKI